MSLFQTDRKLRLWEYTVSLRQLLLRSVKEESGHATNLDVVFHGVRYVAIPADLEGLTVNSGSSTHIREVERLLGRTIVPPTQVFVLESQSRTHLIVAAAMRFEENKLDLKESSLEFSRNEVVKRGDG